MLKIKLKLRIVWTEVDKTCVKNYGEKYQSNLVTNQRITK